MVDNAPLIPPDATANEQFRALYEWPELRAELVVQQKLHREIDAAVKSGRPVDRHAVEQLAEMTIRLDNASKFRNRRLNELAAHVEFICDPAERTLIVNANVADYAIAKAPHQYAIAAAKVVQDKLTSLCITWERAQPRPEVYEVWGHCPEWMGTAVMCVVTYEDISDSIGPDLDIKILVPWMPLNMQAWHRDRHKKKQQAAAV